MKSFVLSALAAVCLAMPSLADTGFQFTAPGGLQSPKDSTVSGMRMSLLHGKTQNVSGFDLGMFSYSETGNSSGFAAIMGLHNITGKSTGCQAGLINVHSGQANGVNAAFVNTIAKMGKGGINIGFVNLVDGASTIDIGGLQIADSAKVQVGFVNIVQKIDSLQIGFLNMAQNGFFPVFPFFNYPKQN